MLIILNPDVYRVKNGFAAYSPELKMTAHGASIEIAKSNLGRTALLLLKPFQREGKLDAEIGCSGIIPKQDGEALTIKVS